MKDVFVGRQPICTRDLNVVGYELLFRGGDADTATVIDGDHATSQVILNSFVEIGLDRLVGQSLAFVNLTRDFILNGYASVFPQGRIVVELLEHAAIDDALIAAARQLVARGCTIALDDFVYRDTTLPLLDLASIVKLDVLALGPEAVKEHVRLLRPHKVRLLAEKIETLEDFAWCRDLGFDYFQGYFFCKPALIRGQRTPGNRLATLLVLSKLQDPDVDFSELEGLIMQDVTLSYKLLRLVNSAFYARPRKVESIRQALILLGTETIATWVSLITLAGIDDKPHELMMTAMVRAKMCEILGRALRLPGADSCFSVGLFSVLDALLDTPMEEVVASLPLSDDLVRALLTREGPLGGLLANVVAYEQAEWDALDLPGLGSDAIAGAYLDAVAWSYQVRAALAA